ncbi:AaceriADR339Cp [[Ashbya] aceris (nom. inval.)]|nr:AaceriADR339Cp [[Ashbya] aceris (nom. inval.)]
MHFVFSLLCIVELLVCVQGAITPSSWIDDLGFSRPIDIGKLYGKAKNYLAPKKERLRDDTPLKSGRNGRGRVETIIGPPSHIKGSALFAERYTVHHKELKAQYRKDYPFAAVVDTFFGTEAGGHMFPGTALPFSMCKMGVDVIDTAQTDAYAGYLTNGEVVGISLLHASGTGGSPTYGVVSQLPMMAPSVGAVDISRQIGFQRSTTDSGHVGYYKVRLNNSVTVEFSSGERSGLYKYRFPSAVGMRPIVMVNVTHHLHSFGRPWWTQNFEKGYIQVNKDMRSYSGKVVIAGGWSDPGAWTVYFYGIFDHAATGIRAFQGTRSVNGLKINLVNDQNKNFGVIFEFAEDVRVLKSHVGISFNKDDGVEIAKWNIVRDIPPEHKFDLSWSVENALKRWDEEVFSKMVLFPANEDPVSIELLHNAIYGVHLMPTEKSGPDAPWETEEPYYDDFFTIWDTFRCLHPLLHFFNQERSAEIIRSLIEIWRHENYMPDGRSGDRSGRTQGGSNADIVLADAYVKRIGGQINWEDGFKAMKANAEVIPPLIIDPMAPDSTNKYGRGALSDWLSHGYVTNGYSRSLTRTMEYAYNDFALYQVAKGLNKTEDAQRYLARSANWQNIWNPHAHIARYNYSGFIQPKDEHGNFVANKYTPLSCFGCYWSDDAYEGKPVEYGWAVPHDMETLRGLIGSEDVFVQRLDDMFGLYGDALADLSNEPSFLTPYLYNYVNRHDRTVETIHYLLQNNFKPGPKGLPGNSDAGAMQAWLFFALIGFYPVAGTDLYLLSAPKFSYLKFTRLPNLGEVEIIAHDLFPNGKRTADARNIYVKSVVINGFALNRNWVYHEELFSEHGSKLEFYMTDKPVAWDKNGPYPPSYGHYEGATTV